MNMNSIGDVVAAVARWQDRIVQTYVQPHALTLLQFAAGAVFFYFGLQKPLPVDSPPKQFIGAFIAPYPVGIEEVMLFIGMYEMTMGVLFFLKRVRVLFFMFFTHQIVAFYVLFTVRSIAFQPPWITAFGADVPWALGSFAAFVLKNLVFLGAFLVILSLELGERDS